MHRLIIGVEALSMCLMLVLLLAPLPLTKQRFEVAMWILVLVFILTMIGDIWLRLKAKGSVFFSSISVSVIGLLILMAILFADIMQSPAADGTEQSRGVAEISEESSDKPKGDANRSLATFSMQLVEQQSGWDGHLTWFEDGNGRTRAIICQLRSSAQMRRALQLEPADLKAGVLNLGVRTTIADGSVLLVLGKVLELNEHTEGPLAVELHGDAGRKAHIVTWLAPERLTELARLAKTVDLRNRKEVTDYLKEVTRVCVQGQERPDEPDK